MISNTTGSHRELPLTTIKSQAPQHSLGWGTQNRKVSVAMLTEQFLASVEGTKDAGLMKWIP